MRHNLKILAMESPSGVVEWHTPHTHPDITHEYTGAVNASIFLSGPMTAWRREVVGKLKPAPATRVVVYDPTNRDWDATWKFGNPAYMKQIEWERAAMRESTYVLVYLPKDTPAPTTHMEMALAAAFGRDVVVVVEDGAPNGDYVRARFARMCTFVASIQDAIACLNGAGECEPL